MITLAILVVLLGALLTVVCLGASVLLDPIIACLAIYFVYRLIRVLVKRRKK